jgi:hypothetical protein
VFNHEHEIVAVGVTLGNVGDSAPAASLVRDPTGKLFDDTGYIGEKRADTLLRQELTLMTRVRKT